MVAEPVTETPTLETPQPESSQVEAPVVDTPAPAGDTGQPESVDAAAAEPDYEAEYQAYVQEQSGKESGEPAPEPTQQREQEPEPQIDPRVYQSLKANYDGAYRTFYGTVDSAVQEMVDSGMPESQAKRIAESLKQAGNTIHASGLQFHGLEAATQAQARANQSWFTGIRQGIEAFVPKSQLAAFDAWLDSESERLKGPVPHKDWMAKAFELKAKADGYVPKAKYDADTKQRWIDGRRGREKAGEVSGSGSGGAINGLGAGGRSEDELLADPSTPIDTVQKILARRGM